jgi:hypothetical protein
MDYDLQRLNARAFEQMVQALAVGHVHGPVTVFGDGPDGGREASWATTADGVDYPAAGVLQVKFRQSPRHRTTVRGCCAS